MRAVGVLLLAAALLLSSCRSRTQYGDCIGVIDEPNPKLVYRASVRNIVVASIFFQTIFAPAIVVLKEWECPVGEKP